MTFPAKGSIVRHVAGWYAALIATLITCYTLVLVLIMQVQATAELDTSLRAALQTQVERLRKGPVESASRVQQGHATKAAEARHPYLDVWHLDPAADDKPVPILISGMMPELENAAEPYSRDPQTVKPLLIKTGSDHWRAMQVVVNRPNRGEFLVRASLPTGPMEAMAGQMLYTSALSVPLIFLLTLAGGMLLGCKVIHPIREIIMATREIRPEDLSKRLPVQSKFKEVRALSSVINTLLERVELTLNKQAQFATEAAHELRTPLAAQRITGELALRSQISTEQLREAVSSMLEDGQHMQKFIDGFLLLARADAGMLPKPRAPIDVATAANRCVQSMIPLTEAKGQLLTCDAHSGYYVLAEESLVRQALMNLVHNAIKHTAEGTHICVGVRATKSSVVLVVTDNGQGFSTFNKGQMVRHAERNAGNENARDTGLGLGLSIAQALVRSQDGVMTVRSAPERGTKIKLTFNRSSAPIRASTHISAHLPTTTATTSPTSATVAPGVRA